jgi:hypothetical protein
VNRITAIGEILRKQTHDVNLSAIELVAAIENDEGFQFPFSHKLRGDLEKLFAEGISDSRVQQAADMIAREYPEELASDGGNSADR